MVLMMVSMTLRPTVISAAYAFWVNKVTSNAVQTIAKLRLDLLPITFMTLPFLLKKRTR
jgi:hypothetical protein